ncbi:MAG: hypothetical protein H7318_08645 [Oligoflexus sp.]|nr:hypothetical protein [Oligoflexus sp.]
MFKKLVVLAILFLPACKILPNKIRSGFLSNEVTSMLDQDSLKFERVSDAKSGLLSFSLKDEHKCRVEYWADDPSGTPPPASPLSVDCPKDKLSLTQKLEIPGLTAGYPLSFRIYVWPKTTTLLTHFVKEFHEGQDLLNAKASNLVVVRYSSPRNSAEIYSYRFGSALNLKDIKSKLGQVPATACTANPKPEAIPFARNSSLEDTQKRPLMGLSAVTTEGFASAAAIQHPFFPTRLIEFYDQTARQENWKWNFQWEAQPFSFESLPPGYIGSLSVGDGVTSHLIVSRNLTGATETIELNANLLQLAPRILFPSDVSRFEITIKSADAAKTLLTCRFAVDKDTVTIPSEFMSKLAQGSYLATFSFETNQVHYKDQGAYPPWIITASDWVLFRLNKRL